MTLADAAFALFHDSRRAVAREVAVKMSSIASSVIHSFATYFADEHACVSGSTYRNTHLPDASDFDIGLLPRSAANFREWPEGQDAFLSYVRELTLLVAADDELLEAIAGLYEVDADALRQALLRDIEISYHVNNPDEPDLITARFRVKRERPQTEDLLGTTVLEISAGTYYWHKVALLYYNRTWSDQLEALGREEVKDRVLSQVCLAKSLARDRDVYGAKAGTPTGRGLEQVVMGHGQEDCPLVAAMDSFLRYGPGAFRPFLTLHGSAAAAGLPHDAVLRGFESEKDGLARFRELAKDIVGDRVDWTEYFVRHGIE